jgi:hypothetical protein
LLKEGEDLSLFIVDRFASQGQQSGYLVVWSSGKPNFWVSASTITSVMVTSWILA